VACQIVHIEPLARGTVVDLVTLEPCDRGATRVPAGTPLTLAFGSGPAEETRSSLESAMTLWESTCTPLRLHVGDAPEGLRYHSVGGDRFLTLLVADRPGSSAN
jgi:hypothetical protein